MSFEGLKYEELPIVDERTHLCAAGALQGIMAMLRDMEERGYLQVYAKKLGGSLDNKHRLQAHPINIAYLIDEKETETAELQSSEKTSETNGK